MEQGSVKDLRIGCYLIEIQLAISKHPTRSKDSDHVPLIPHPVLTPHLRTQLMRRSTRLDLDLWLGDRSDLPWQFWRRPLV